VLKQPDVGLEAGDERLALLPAQRLTLTVAALQEPLDGARHGARCRPGQEPARRAARPQRPGHRPVGQRRFGMRRDVLPRHIGDDTLLDTEKAADPVEGPGRLADEVAIPQHQDLVTREQREQALELLAVTAEPGVVPEGCPARGYPLVLFPAGADEVTDRLEARRPQVSPVGVGAFHRITQHGDQPGVRDELADAPHRLPVVQVQRRGLTAQRPGRGRIEERLVAVTLPHVLTVGQGVTRAAARRRRPVGEEELRLLDR